MPTGVYLRGEGKVCQEDTTDGDGIIQRHLTRTDQMTTATILMMASFKLSKNSNRTCPCCFMLPMIRPRHTEKTTNPRAFTPSEELGTGTSCFYPRKFTLGKSDLC